MYKDKDIEGQESKTTQLAKNNERLNKEIVDLESENEWFYRIFDSCPFGIVASTSDLRMLNANQYFIEMLGYSLKELKEMKVWEYTPEKWHKKEKEATRKFFNNKKHGPFEKEYIKKDGTIIPVVLYPWLVYDTNGKPSTVFVIIKDNTKGVSAKNELLQKQIELETKTRRLEESSTALRVFMQHSKEDRRGFEENIVVNIKEVIFPYMEELERNSFDSKQKEFLSIIKTHLEEIISPFYHRLSSRYTDLTPTEIRIAGLVKEGRTTKDIAQLLGLSSGTIEFHRNNLRKKLGLRNTKSNLRSHLFSME